MNKCAFFSRLQKKCLYSFFSWFFSFPWPQFWNRIINILKVDEHDIQQAREVLHLLGYNNLAAIAKLNKPHAISSLELEFQKKKETTNFDERLRPICFGSGTSITIAEIAKAAIKCLQTEEFTANERIAIKNSIFEDCKKVIR